MKLDDLPECMFCKGTGGWYWKEGSPYGKPGTKACDCGLCVGTGRRLPSEMRLRLRAEKDAAKAQAKMDKREALKALLAAREAEVEELRRMVGGEG
jgi:hypothetical protein